jgi:hypothetical protein
VHHTYNIGDVAQLDTAIEVAIAAQPFTERYMKI